LVVVGVVWFFVERYKQEESFLYKLKFYLTIWNWICFLFTGFIDITVAMKCVFWIINNRTLIFFRL
jgi:hypothetical protein